MKKRWPVSIAFFLFQMSSISEAKEVWCAALADDGGPLTIFTQPQEVDQIDKSYLDYVAKNIAGKGYKQVKDVECVENVDGATLSKNTRRGETITLPAYRNFNGGRAPATKQNRSSAGAGRSSRSRNTLVNTSYGDVKVIGEARDCLEIDGTLVAPRRPAGEMVDVIVRNSCPKDIVITGYGGRRDGRNVKIPSYKTLYVEISEPGMFDILSVYGNPNISASTVNNGPYVRESPLSPRRN